MRATATAMMRASSRAFVRRIAFVLGWSTAILLVLAVLLPVLAGAGMMAALTAGGCGAAPPLPAGLRAEAVTLPSARWGTRSAWLVLPDSSTPGQRLPGQRLAVVIAIPTGSADRGDRADEWRHYVAAGLAVLSYASNACSGQAFNGLGGAEADLSDALAFVAAHPALDPMRIGLHGFSAGGASALLAVGEPDMPGTRIRAVVAQGNYLDFAAILRGTAQPLGLFGAPFWQAARLTYQARTGRPIETLTPGAAAARFAPRPILLIYGDGDSALVDARRLADAQPHVTLWHIPGALHGTYVRTAGEAAYGARVGQFMTAALRENRPCMAALRENRPCMAALRENRP
jgi:dienelactone hydrolase